ncbi:DUF3558 family protein [Corynebacterium sp. HMSC078H07]|uniref:DUF3558 family protein n=1 Tax=Corynebacterium sp. HMSC078H07 TaxID=1739379 RepID=UPI0009F2FBB7|nr:DUF3558 family protein [Corynebacterium sp. HMSC078H07]
MKRIGGLVLVAACMGVLSSCASLQGLGVRSHGVGTGGSHDFSDVKDGGDSAVSGVADVTATGERGNETASGVGQSGGGVLPPLGSFDRTQAGFRVFDPCEEILTEALEPLGLERSGEPRKRSGYRSCDFAFISGASTASVTVEARQETMDEIKNAFPESFSAVQFRTPNAYGVEDEFIPNATCTVFIETIRGIVSVSWTEIRADKTMSEKCLSADRILFSLM